MEDDSSKTEQPTAKKKRDARDKGQVAHSKDVSSFVVITTFLIMFFMWRTWFCQTASQGYFAVFQTITQSTLSFIDIAQLAMGLVTTAMKFVLTLVCIAALTVGSITVVQLGGFLMKKEPFKVDMQKFNPVSNLKQMFAKKNLLKFVMNIFKIIVMGFVGVHLVQGMLHDILLLSNASISEIVLLIAYCVFKILIVLLGIYFIFAMIDIVSEKRAAHKKLMMSRHEIEKEYKETDGNPEVKGRRRELHRELLEGDDDMWETNKDHMMVLANPTHIAVILLYMPHKFKLPVVIVKAKGYVAQMIFKTAARHNVPIIREKWVARQMYAYAKVKQFVPPSLTLHIADIIAKNLHLLPVIEREIKEIRGGASMGKVATPFANKG
jgi:type III secretion protein U